MKQIFKDAAVLIFFISSFICLFLLMQTKHIWGDIYIEQIFVNLQENAFSAVSNKMLYGYLISFLLAVVSAIAFSLIFKRNKHLLIMAAVCYVFTFWQIGFFSYIFNKTVSSELYEKQYINPQNLNFTFPQKKRNLIVIYLESMEENYANALKKNLIPGIYSYMKSGLSFKGYHQIANQDYTMAGLIESFCAVVYKKNILKGGAAYQNFLPNLVCYPEILQKNDYQTVFIKGSDINFARADIFAKTHGFNVVMGSDELEEKFHISLSQNKGTFGGYHDEALYNMIKTELLELSSSKKPFFLSFLTLDTHAPDYFLSPSCGGEASQKQDIIQCADTLLSNFLDWLQKQSFYDNTTVIVLGDHTKTGINRLYPNLKDRKIVNFILNPSPLAKKQNHFAFTMLDIAPSVLNSIGIRFETNAFGLGRSLFDNKPTLFEQMGLKFETELAKSSKFYDSFEMIKIKSEPPYYPYTLAKQVTDSREIALYATYAYNVFDIIYTDELSFTLPEHTASDLTFDILFKTMFMQKQKQTIKVYLNDQYFTSWNVTLHDIQPISKSLNIPAGLIKNNKLKLSFETGEQMSSLKTSGIGILSFQITP